MLRKIGEALFGPQWQSELARQLSVADRTMRRWLSSDDLPDGVRGDLVVLCIKRRGEIDAIIAGLDGSLVSLIGHYAADDIVVRRAPHSVDKVQIYAPCGMIQAGAADMVGDRTVLEALWSRLPETDRQTLLLSVLHLPEWMTGYEPDDRGALDAVRLLPPGRYEGLRPLTVEEHNAIVDMLDVLRCEQQARSLILSEGAEIKEALFGAETAAPDEDDDRGPLESAALARLHAMEDRALRYSGWVCDLFWGVSRRCAGRAI